jgi:hypothetical protein
VRYRKATVETRSIFFSDKGVPVYKFKDGDKKYWLWDGSKNNPHTVRWMSMKKDALVLQLECARQR